MQRFFTYPTLLILCCLFILIACNPEQKNEKEMNQKAELFYKIDAQLGEGPIWNHQSNELFWVDIEGLNLHILNPATKENRSIPTPSRIGTVVPIDNKAAIVGLQDGTYLVDTQSGEFSLHTSLDSANLATRLNDGKCDPAGRLWVGTMYMPQDKPDGHLFMVDGSGNSTQQLDSITISNGIVWTADKKTMYYIDTPTGKVRGYDYDNATGEIKNERTSVAIPEELGFPDGMTIDEEGKLWIGLWNGDAIVRFDPETGKMLSRIDVPAHNVTACAFGGENLDSLFITTARLDMTAEELEKYPDAGSVFVVVPGVKGVKSDFFKLTEE